MQVAGQVVGERGANAPSLGLIISNCCSCSLETEFIPLTLASKSRFS